MAAKTEADRLAEERELDLFQKREIYDEFARVIESFNEHTEGPTASIEPVTEGSFQIRLPRANSATVSFFPVSPPLTIEHRSVRFGALVADHKGCGFNLLLMRAAGDLYGEWTVCRVRANVGSGRRHPDCEVFGFGPREIAEIESGHRAMHVYVPEFSSEVGPAVEAFLQTLYRGD